MAVATAWRLRAVGAAGFTAAHLAWDGAASAHDHAFEAAIEHLMRVVAALANDAFNATTTRAWAFGEVGHDSFTTRYVARPVSSPLRKSD